MDQRLQAARRALASTEHGRRYSLLPEKLRHKFEYFGVTAAAEIPESLTADQFNPKDLQDPLIERLDPLPDAQCMSLGFQKTLVLGSAPPLTIVWNDTLSEAARYLTDECDGEGVAHVHTGLRRERTCLAKVILQLLVTHAVGRLAALNRQQREALFNSELTRLGEATGLGDLRETETKYSVMNFAPFKWRCTSHGTKNSCTKMGLNTRLGRALAKDPSYYDGWFKAAKQEDLVERPWYREHSRRCSGNFLQINPPDDVQLICHKRVVKARNEQLRSLAPIVTLLRIEITRTQYLDTPKRVPRADETTVDEELERDLEGNGAGTSSTGIADPRAYFELAGKLRRRFDYYGVTHRAKFTDWLTADEFSPTGFDDPIIADVDPYPPLEALAICLLKSHFHGRVPHIPVKWDDCMPNSAAVFVPGTGPRHRGRCIAVNSALQFNRRHLTVAVLHSLVQHEYQLVEDEGGQVNGQVIATRLAQLASDTGLPDLREKTFKHPIDREPLYAWRCEVNDGHHVLGKKRQYLLEHMRMDHHYRHNVYYGSTSRDIETASWQEAHKHFCGGRFVAVHIPTRKEFEQHANVLRLRAASDAADEMYVKMALLELQQLSRGEPMYKEE